MEARQTEPLADDLLHGAREIADFLGLSERQAFHQIERGNIPTTRMGRLIVGSKTVLRRRFAPSEAA
jgi:hypothetical protein